jgi:hypothetical protein
MRRSKALRQLPPAHALVIRLADEGLDVAQLANRLHLDPSAVGPLLLVAKAKLAALEALDEPDDPPGRNKTREGPVSLR